MTVGMSVEYCVNFCNSSFYTYASREDGNLCCKCTSRRCLPRKPLVRDLRRFDHTFWIVCGNVTTSGATPSSNCNTTAKAILERSVVELTLSAFTGVVFHNPILLWFRPWAREVSRDGTGTHIPFTFLVRRGTSDGRECFVNSDSNNARTLAWPVTVSDGGNGLTIELCLDACIKDGRTHAGVELGNQCCTRRLFN